MRFKLSNADSITIKYKIVASFVYKVSHTGQAFRQLTEGFLFVDQGVSVFATKIITPQLEFVVLDETT
jgi:hypothetical protein